MERVKLNISRVALLLLPVTVITCYLVAVFFSKILSQQLIFFELFMLSLTTYFTAISTLIWSNRTSNLGLGFSSDSLIFNSKNKQRTINWKDVKVKKHNLLFLPVITLVDIKTGKRITSYFWGWYSNESLFSLTKTYAPKDHDLYKLIEGYAKERRLDF